MYDFSVLIVTEFLHGQVSWDSEREGERGQGTPSCPTYIYAHAQQCRMIDRSMLSDWDVGTVTSTLSLFLRSSYLFTRRVAELRCFIVERVKVLEEGCD